MMKTGRMTVWGLCGALIILANISSGEIVYGPDAKAYFEELRNRVGDQYVDFEAPQFSTGVLSTATIEGVGLSFKTAQVRFPTTANVNYPVYVRSNTLTRNNTQSLMGVGYSGSGADGQSQYEIVFSEPQGRVGMMRNWNTASITRFYNPDGVLLGEHKNTTSDEFVAWKANGPELDQWVSKVVIDGEYSNGAYQVGETDELYFGTKNPDEGGFRGGLLYGDEAEGVFAQFKGLLGDTLEDFNNLPNGPVRTIEADNGIDVLTLTTTKKQYPKPPVAVDYPVCVIPYGGVTTPSGTNELMGASSPSGNADGQNAYEISFSRIQHRVGILRYWNTSSVTRFYAEDGSLLAEHQNTANREFVGWVGDPGDQSTWVKRVEMDGVLYQNAYQVGRADDLQYGRALPDRRDMEIVDFSLGANHSVSISWFPAQVNHSLEYSYDMINWQPAEGVLSGDSWTGTISGDPTQVFFRVLTEELF
jgi:hypothetical protein